jgi:Trypsin-like peptidase domain
VVEKADHYWPFVTCVAVGQDTLLTAARYATDLADMRDKDLFKVWVTRPADSRTSNGAAVKFSFKARVKDIRVLAPYAVLSEKAESAERRFVDVALLTVEGALPKVAPLASSRELDAVDEGFPVHCFGFTHEGRKMTHYDSDRLKPRMTDGSVYLIGSAPPKLHLPGEPKLLQVQAEIPKNSYGSPVVNGDGNIMGLYSDALPEERSQPVKNLHYVTMINRELVDCWLRDRDNARIWVPASPLSAPPTTKKQP